MVQFTTSYRTEDTESMEASVEEITKEEATFEDLNFFSKDIDWKCLEEDLENIEWNIEFCKLGPNGMMQKFLAICLNI